MLRRLLASAGPSLRSSLGQTRGCKVETGIVGLEAVPEARVALAESLQEVKRLVGELIPESAEYRKVVEQTCDHRLGLIKEHASDGALEDAFGAQIEEMIQQSKDELGLIPKMAAWKPWEAPEDREIPSFLERDPYEDGPQEGGGSEPALKQ